MLVSTWNLNPSFTEGLNAFYDRLTNIIICLATMLSVCAFHIMEGKMVKDLKGKVIRVQAVEAHRGGRGTAPLVLNLDAR